MESDLLALFKLFIYVQNTLYDKINAHFHQMVLYKEYFFDIYKQPNSNLIIIENLFENLVRSFDSINEFVLNNVSTFKSSVKSFENNLKFIEKISLYFSTYQNFLNLAEKEKPVYAIYAKLTNGLNTEGKIKKDKGILFITNLDLSFVHEYGVRKKKKALTFKAPVRDLIRIRDKGKVFKKLYLEFEYGKYEFTLPPKSISRVIEYILLARTFDETTVYDRKSASDLQKIDIDLNSLTNFIEESINSFFSLKCQYNESYEKVNNFNKSQPQYPYGNHNQTHNLAPQSHQQGAFNQYPNMGQIKQNQPRMENPYYQHPTFDQLAQAQYFQGLNNYLNQANQYQIPLHSESKFFPQNIYNPNRYQNYNPQVQNSNNDLLLNTDERQLINRNLEQIQGQYQQTSNFRKQNMFNDKHFEEFNRNHLSDLFNQSNSSTQQSYGYKRQLFKLDKEKQKRMLELEKERYSLKATLKKLETKFDQGSISESDYFRTYRNLNKEIYLVNNKIQTLQQSLEELESIKQNSRNFDNKGFYT
jgi:hypothetical protein